MTTQPPISFEVTATRIEDIDRLSQQWLALEKHSTSHSFFLSWYWIGCWLRCLPVEVAPLLLRISAGSLTVGLGVIVPGSTPILSIGRLSQISLNATGDKSFDCIAIEYNGFLAASGLEKAVTSAGLDWLLQGGVPNQSISLSGIAADIATIAVLRAKAHGREAYQLQQSPAPFVNLAAIRESGADYLTHISRNSRQSLKRSLRYYETIGPLEYHAAKSSDEALLLFDKMQLAHQIYWQSRGKPGSFSQPFFKQFHCKLIEAAFADGHIEMARISAGDQMIGYLYNFIWGNTVYAYQSGFHYIDHTYAKPGYVSHYLAILNALKNKRGIYDFMAGDRQHKTSLSTELRNLAWLQLRSQILSVRTERYLRSLLTAISNY